MKQYTLGFVFDSSLESVLLMHKTKPERQVGKINGLGGKVEKGEDSRACIAREVKEEADLKTARDEWVYVGNMHSAEWSVDVFGLIYVGAMSDAKSIELERIEWFSIDALPPNIISNLSWLISMVKDRLRDRIQDEHPVFTFSVVYR